MKTGRLQALNRSSQIAFGSSCRNESVAPHRAAMITGAPAIHDCQRPHLARAHTSTSSHRNNGTNAAGSPCINASDALIACGVALTGSGEVVRVASTYTAVV